MDTKIELDTVLDLVQGFQDELAKEIDLWRSSTTVREVLWTQYRRTTKLYDSIRRAA